MPRRRTPQEIVDELRRLQQAPDAVRDRMSLIHEVSVYQEELLVQNEALIRAQSALEETRDQFIELYDFAPTGYLTLDENGVIRQCNLTAASMFGRAKSRIEGFPLLGFVAERDRVAFTGFLHRCRTASTPPGLESELVMNTADGERTLQLFCRPRTHQNRREYFTSLVDVTDRRTLEMERARAAADRAALMRRLITAQDEERQRIARNLHDDIGQQHTAIRLRLDRLEQHAHEDALRQMIAETRQLFSRLDQRVHFVATELRPSALDLGLVGALGQFAREWAETFQVAVDVVSHLPAGQRLSPEIETHLYRIVQEALNNIAKHAGARHVSIVLDIKDTAVILIIEDDGKGFDADSARRGRSPLGILGMEERAHIIGGQFEIESAPGHGTSVFVTVPHAT